MFDWIPLFGMVTSTFTVVFIVYIVTTARTRRLEAQVQMQTKLIERFGSATELVEFLHSPAGRQFVAGVQSAPVAMARERILGGFTRSIILTALGVAFLAIGLVQGEDFWYVPASIILSLGVGYLLATYVAWRFARRLETGESFSQTNP